MGKNKMFKKISKEKQKQYEEEVKSKWGEERFKESNRNWDSFDSDKQNSIKEECYLIFTEIAENMHNGLESKEIQDVLIKWHKFLQNFYEPSLEVLRGLGIMYSYDPDFRKNFEEIDPELPDFLENSINYYVDELEMRWLESQYQVLEE